MLCSCLAVRISAACHYAAARVFLLRRLQGPKINSEKWLTVVLNRLPHTQKEKLHELLPQVWIETHPKAIIIKQTKTQFLNNDVPGHRKLFRDQASEQLLYKVVRQCLDVNHSLRNLELVVIDTMLRILSDTQLFIKTRNAVFKFRHNRAYLVYECLRHGNSGEGEL